MLGIDVAFVVAVRNSEKRANLPQVGFTKVQACPEFDMVEGVMLVFCATAASTEHSSTKAIPASPKAVVYMALMASIGRSTMVSLKIRIDPGIGHLKKLS